MTLGRPRVGARSVAVMRLIELGEVGPRLPRLLGPLPMFTMQVCRCELLEKFLSIITYGSSSPRTGRHRGRWRRLSRWHTAGILLRAARHRRQQQLLAHLLAAAQQGELHHRLVTSDQRRPCCKPNGGSSEEPEGSRRGTSELQLVANYFELHHGRCVSTGADRIYDANYFDRG